MYTTPTVRAVPAPEAQSLCCHIVFKGEENSFVVTNPACGPVIRQFPTCSINTPVGGLALCSASIQTSQGTLTISGT